MIAAAGSALAATPSLPAPPAHGGQEAPAAVAEPLRIAVIQRSGTQQVAARLLEAVYAHAGIPMRIVPLPAERATVMADRGEIDGEAARIGSYYADRPAGVVVVRPALMRTVAVVFMRRAAARPVGSVAALHGLRVGVVRGVRQSLAAVEGVERVERVERVEQLNTARQLYAMLRNGHLDAVVDSPVSHRRYAAELAVDDVVAAGVLSELEVFHALHPRHAALAPRVGAALVVLRDSGELARLQAAAEAEASRPTTEAARGWR